MDAVKEKIKIASNAPNSCTLKTKARRVATAENTAGFHVFLPSEEMVVFPHAVSGAIPINTNNIKNNGPAAFS